MASYTGLRELKNHPHRSGFDISQKNVFSAKVGELLPVYWDISIPGNTYEIKPQYFTRTQPLNTDAYTRIREYFDVYEIPVRLLWKSAPSALTQMGEKNPLQAIKLGDSLKVGTGLPSFPLSDLSRAIFNINQRWPNPNPVNYNYSQNPDNLYAVNQFGFSRGSCAYKLLRYLQYGNFIDPDDADHGPVNWATAIQPSDDGYDSILDSQKYRTNAFVNALPLLAYNKIYQDFFRWNQWENPDPSSYNVDYFDGNPGDIIKPFYGELPDDDSDYWKSPTMFDLRYANFKKDLFMGVLPETQFGDVSTVINKTSSTDGNVLSQIGMTIPSNTFIGRVILEGRNNSDVILGGTFSDPDGTSFGVTTANPNVPDTGDNLAVRTNQSINLTGQINLGQDLINTVRTSFSILQLRRAEAEQRWKEISQSGDYDYRDQVYKHFGVKIPAALSNLAIWHGGISRNLDISEVVNTNLDSDDSAPTIHGKGTGSGDGYFKFTTDEHSVVMIIYHAEPVLDYSLNGPTGQLWATDATDIPIPEFDNIGMESVHLEQFFNSDALSSIIREDVDTPLYMGYQPRYYPWKTKLDIVNGAFTGTLRTWVSSYSIEDFLRSLIYRFADAQGEDGTPSIDPVRWNQLMNYNIFRINPHILDNMFLVHADSTWDTDQLLINSYFDVKLVENLSRDGLPY